MLRIEVRGQAGENCTLVVGVNVRCAQWLEGACDRRQTDREHRISGSNGETHLGRSCYIPQASALSSYMWLEGNCDMQR